MKKMLIKIALWMQKKNGMKFLKEALLVMVAGAVFFTALFFVMGLVFGFVVILK